MHVVRSASTILEAEAAVREMREEEVRPVSYTHLDVYKRQVFHGRRL